MNSTNLTNETIFNVINIYFIESCFTLIFLAIIIVLCILLYINRKNHLLISTILIIIGILGIIYITLMILFIPTFFKELSALYILFVSLITFSLKIYFKESKFLKKISHMKKKLCDALENIKFKSIEYWIRVDVNIDYLSDDPDLFEKINFNFNEFENIIMEIDMESKDNTFEYMNIVNNYVIQINDNIYKLKDLLIQKEKLIGIDNVENFIKECEKKGVEKIVPHPSNAKLIDGLEDREKRLYVLCAQLALYSDMLISNNLNENKDDNRYEEFKKISEEKTFVGKKKIVENSKIFEKYKEDIGNYSDYDGKTLKDKINN